MHWGKAGGDSRARMLIALTMGNQYKPGKVLVVNWRLVLLVSGLGAAGGRQVQLQEKRRDSVMMFLDGQVFGYHCWVAQACWTKTPLSGMGSNWDHVKTESLVGKAKWLVKEGR